VTVFRGTYFLQDRAGIAGSVKYITLQPDEHPKKISKSPHLQSHLSPTMIFQLARNGLLQRRLLTDEAEDHVQLRGHVVQITAHFVQFNCGTLREDELQVALMACKVLRKRREFFAVFPRPQRPCC
jgi:transketolase N-terminal domain/subunit